VSRPEAIKATKAPGRFPWRWLVLVGLVAACLLGYRITTRTPPAAATPGGGLGPAVMRPLRRDERLYQQARALAAQAETAAERALGTQAQHAADNVMDLSFTIALQRAAALGATASPTSSALIEQIQAEIGADQEQIASLQRASGRAGAAAELAVARAQLGLDQARLRDATADAARSGPGGTARIEQLQQEHEAMHAADARLAASAAPPPPRRGLVGALERAWQFSSTLDRLGDAQAAARLAVAQILAEHDADHARLRTAEQAPIPAPSAARVQALRDLLRQQQQISRFDQQADAAAELADTYAQWMPLVATQRQRALHQALGQALLLLAILAGLFLLLEGWRRLLEHPRWDRKRATTLRHVLTLASELLAGLVALFVLFGQPPNLVTILGFFGAGLTLVFSDAILSLAGWFVLMGRHGVRLGDWVEINGVVGEVIEIHLLRTVLLETGNWITAGHPTGRRVFFPNNFALKGSYFNYSTHGQWQWDELVFALPAGGDTHAALTRVTAALELELRPQAERANVEWQHLPSQAGGSTAPSVHLRPEGGGYALVVRYTTPARQRAETRERLWQVLAVALAAPPPAGDAVPPPVADAAAGS